MPRDTISVIEVLVPNALILFVSTAFFADELLGLLNLGLFLDSSTAFIDDNCKSSFAGHLRSYNEYEIVLTELSIVLNSSEGNAGKYVVPYLYVLS